MVSGGNGLGKHESGSFRVQKQIRQNAEEVQHSIADLFDWEKTVKKQDKKISRAKTKAESTPAPAPAHSSGGRTQPVRRLARAFTEESSTLVEQVRDTNHPRKKQTVGKSSSRRGQEPPLSRKSDKKSVASQGDKGSAASHTYDVGYKKWDKFDVDAALKSSDEEAEVENIGKESDTGSEGDSDGGESLPMPALTPATMVGRHLSGASKSQRVPVPSSAPAMVPAPPVEGQDPEKEERDRGNDFFRRGEFQQAVKCYTRCLGLNNKSVPAFSNRAMAYLKLKEFVKAEGDCTLALEIDPAHVKSLQRRASAMNALGKHRAALADLLAAAKACPGSKEIRNELSKTKETLTSAARRAPKQRVKVGLEDLPTPQPRPFINTQGPGSPLRMACAVAGNKTVAPKSIATASAHLDTIGSTTDVSIPGMVPPTSIPSSASVDETAAESDRAVPPVVTSLAAVPVTTDSLASSSSEMCRGVGLTDTLVVDGVIGADEAVDITCEREIVSTDKEDFVVECDSSASVSTKVGERSVSDEVQGSDLASSVKMTRPVVPNIMPSSVCLSKSDTVVEDTPVRRRIKESGVGVDTPWLVADAAPAGAAEMGAYVVDTGRSPQEEAYRVESGDERVIPTQELSSNFDRRMNTSSPTRSVIISETVAASASGVSSAAGTLGSSVKGSQSGRKTGASLTPALVPANKEKEAVKKSKRLPSTAYELERVWRSTASNQDVRLHLMRTLPPSDVIKLFKRTPVEVELLEGLLSSLGPAFLPDSPELALKWLVSLAKANRFSMAMTLVGKEVHHSVTEVLDVVGRYMGTGTEELQALRTKYQCS